MVTGALLYVPHAHLAFLMSVLFLVTVLFLLTVLFLMTLLLGVASVLPGFLCGIRAVSMALRAFSMAIRAFSMAIRAFSSSRGPRLSSRPM